mmetsp:Transcript_8620/g.15478  ORF Transcript_8620/g.15478 Transcript_8620/m.15478 type:complete len:160 (-) Transcript_8620:16-495(-)
MGVSPSHGTAVVGPMAVCCGSCKIITQQSRARDSACAGKSFNPPCVQTIQPQACTTGEFWHQKSYDPDAETLNDPFLFQGSTAEVEPDSSSGSEAGLHASRWRPTRPGGPSQSSTASQSTCASEDSKPRPVSKAMELPQGDRPIRIGGGLSGQSGPRKV